MRSDDAEAPRQDGASNAVEAAVLGVGTVRAVRALFDEHLRRRLGSGVARVRFRSGRIDAVWGVELEDGRPVVIKAHRPPVDVPAARAAGEAQRALVEAGFPAPVPLSGPEREGAHVLTVETLLEGAAPDGRDPAVRRLLAAELARSVDLLRSRTELLESAGPGPSWCRYQAGPWPVPHDPIVDLEVAPAGYEWLDRFAQRASAQVLEARVGLPEVVAHADWYAGNVLVRGGALTGVLDWELVVGAEAVVAGFAAAGFATSATGGGGLSTPEEAATFLDEYAEARGTPFTPAERRAAAGAAAWIAAFNTRWQVGLLHLGIADVDEIEHVRRRHPEYLEIGRG